VDIELIDKSAQAVSLVNVSTVEVNLDGWTLCSTAGSEQIALSGTIAPGKSTVVTGNIWDSDTLDHGALYNAAGQLVSYYRDSD
jgi:hypothetical protein